MVKDKSAFVDSFDRVLIEDEQGQYFLFDCSDKTAPNYCVSLMPVVITDTQEMLFCMDAVIWSCKFYAVNELNKRGMLSSMLVTLELEEDLDNPVRLQREFGGTINGLYQRPGQA